MTGSSTIFLTFLRDAWMALAGAFLAFALLAGLAQMLRVSSASVLGANLWVWESVSALLSIVLIGLFAFLGIPQIVRALEDLLLHDYALPLYGSALVAVDYLNRVPVVGLTGMMNEEGRSGEAAAALRALARQHGWAVIAAAALKSDHFNDSDDLSALLGDERVPYEADRVLVVQRNGEVGSCGCVPLEVITLKDRTGPPSRWPMQFWGARFYPALEPEFHRHEPLVLA